MKPASAYEITQNPFQLLDKQWAMVTTQVGETTNTMTASWGGVGVLWNKPVVYVFLRPQRYTRDLLDQSERFSLCFLPESYRDQMRYCGTRSGRDHNKLEACGLTAITLDGAPVLTGSNLAFTCRKLFCQQLTPESFADQTLDAINYPSKDYHLMYVAEIIGTYEA